MIGNSFSGRRESRKRRRLSERRRVFSRLGAANSSGDFTGTSTDGYSSWSSSGAGAGESPAIQRQSTTNGGAGEQQYGCGSRSDSPLGDNTKIQMKIQFHITVAPDDEPLILDLAPLAGAELAGSSATLECPPTPPATAQTSPNMSASGRAAIKQMRSTESIGDQIHERLTRQNTLSTRRRHQLMAMHNQAVAASDEGDKPAAELAGLHRSSMPDHLPAELDSPAASPFMSRDSGARSSTITGGIMDEATMRFLARHHAYESQRNLPGRASIAAGPQRPQARLSSSSIGAGQQQPDREHIYFKRDGQRFGHEFTLKLAVDKTYRCLLKVRPLIPLQGITIQGHQVLFVDCSHQASGAASKQSAGHRAASVSAPASSSALNNSWQDFASAASSRGKHNNSNNNNNNNNHRHNNHQSRQRHQLEANSSSHPHYPSPTSSNNSSTNHRLAATSHAANRGAGGQFRGHHQTRLASLNRDLLYQQQQSQMLRHFATSHCSSSNSHLGGQLIYMFDWSAAGRFEVNKNKNRTQVNAVLKFKNGQILSLPLQIKFYQPECRQHLNWGSQLHFIDFDCNINSMGQMNVDRIQYY